ncbi:MAG: NAD-dependent epimerase/dehydratase family protein [Bacteroidetes bacterium]|nr:NAD-dependent epimerase/dehydratase family protein [Bacteroidota bacterium]
MNQILKQDCSFISTRLISENQQLNFKTIFITGGTGFFGKCFLNYFLYLNTLENFNIKVIILSRNPEVFLKEYPQFNNQNFKFITGDVKNFNYPSDSIDYIIHAATDVNYSLFISDPLSIYESIVNGTKHVLELAKYKKATILNISSGAIYGEPIHNKIPFSEDFRGSSNIYSLGACYSEGKKISEMLSYIYNTKDLVNVKIARCFCFVGPFIPLNGQFAIGNFIKNVIRNEDLKISGDGTAYRSYLYTADLIIWLIKILLNGKNADPYNVGSDEEISIKNLADLIIQITKKNLNIDIKSKMACTEGNKYIPDIQKAKSELKLNVNYDLTTSIKRTIDFYQYEPIIKD